jgi:hypothetical protein
MWPPTRADDPKINICACWKKEKQGPKWTGLVERTRGERGLTASGPCGVEWTMLRFSTTFEFWSPTANRGGHGVAPLGHHRVHLGVGSVGA